MAAKDVRIGLIGAGRIAQVAHLPAAEKASGIEVLAIADPNRLIADGVAERYGIRAHGDASELLADDDIEAVIISAPDRFHLELGLQALNAGKHVLIEKPLAATSDEARTLGETAARLGLKLQIGSMKRHDPGIEFAKDQLPRLGTLLSVQSWYRVMSVLRPGIEATLFPPVIMDPETRAHENSLKAAREQYLLVTHGAHVFDGIRNFAGDLSSLRAQVAHIGDDYTWHGTGEIRNGGGLLSFEITTNVHAEWAEGFEIYGENGHISVRTHFPFFRRASDVTVFLESERVTTSPSFDDTNAYERQLESFAAAIRNDTDPVPNAAEGLAAVRYLEAVAASTASDGATIPL